MVAHFDQHLKHWIWLILVVVLVVGVRWWLKRRGKKKLDHQGKTIALGKAFYASTSGAPCLMRRLCVLSCLPKFYPLK
ncbi:hypothetical protein ACLK2F_12025 [Escherichia coli]